MEIAAEYQLAHRLEYPRSNLPARDGIADVLGKWQLTNRIEREPLVILVYQTTKFCAAGLPMELRSLTLL